MKITKKEYQIKILDIAALIMVNYEYTKEYCVLEAKELVDEWVKIVNVVVCNDYD
jgi:hypothetical protein